LTETPPVCANFGALLKPNNMQGKKVGVMYSEADFPSIISVVISKSSKAGECAQGTFNSLEM